MQKESAESLRQRLQEEQERLAEYDLLELVVVNSEVRDGRKIFPPTPKHSLPSLSFNPKVVFMPHCMFEEEEKEAELAEIRMQECSDDEDGGDVSTPLSNDSNSNFTPRTRPKRHSFGDLQDAPLASEAPKLEVQSTKGRQKSDKFHDKLSRARLAKTREKARELGDNHQNEDAKKQQEDEPKLGDLSFDEKSGRVTDKYSRARLARMHRSATGGTLAKIPDVEFLAEGRSRALTPYLELHVAQTLPRDETSGKILSMLQGADTAQLSSQLQAMLTLDLQRCELDDVAVGKLAHILEGPVCLSSLDLGFNLFGDPAASSLGDMLKLNTTLTSLDLSGNDLKDPLLLGEGLKVNKGLQSLYLIDCPITQNAADIVSIRSALEVQMLLRKGQVGTTIHLDSTTTLTVPLVEGSQAARWYLSVSQPDPPTVLQLWTTSRISVEDIYRRSPKAESLLYALIPQLRLERGADRELIKALALSKIFSKLNSSDISYRDMCPAPIRAFIDGCTHVCGRFLLHPHLPEFESPERAVFRATDNQIKAEVLLVLFSSEACYRHERLQQVGLEPSSVLQIVFGSEDWSQWRDDVQRLCGRTHPWGVVMPAFQRSLLQIIQQEPWSISEIKQMLRSAAKCLSHVHSVGRVHGNVTPRHIVRMADKSFKLMGLEAMVPFGVPCGTHTASAYCPPELALLRAEGVAPGLVLPATASFDLWGLGVVLFRMLRRAPLFGADDEEELWGSHSRASLENWGIESLGETLHQLSRSLRVLPLSDRDRLAACDLLGALLQRQGHVRPTCEAVLAHTFLQGESGGWFMSPDHVNAALESVRAGALVGSTLHYSHQTPLHLAVEGGRLVAVQSLLDQNASLDCKDANGRTPLECMLQSRPHEQLSDGQLRVCRHLCGILHIEDYSSLGFPESVLRKLRQLSGPQLGDTLRVKTNAGERTGVVKFLGKTSFAPDDWIGMDLGTATGKNDGSVQGVSYFSCSPGQGIFVQHLAVLENLGKVGPEPVRKAEVRGECDICRNPVTTDDQRMRTPEGNYRHLTCQPLPDFSSMYKVTLIESNQLGAMIPAQSVSEETRPPVDERERALEERERQLAERERVIAEKQQQLEDERKGSRPRKPSPSPTRPVAREGIHLRPATVGVECEFIPRHGVIWGGMICAKCGVRRKDHRLVPPKPEPRR